ncbi:hypothetical protein [Cellulomonas soli]
MTTTPDQAVHHDGPHCQSCGMPVESGPYCQFCTDEQGNLQAFEERFERMVGWQARETPDAPREQIEAQTLAYMATMPAWHDHPDLLARTARG